MKKDYDKLRPFDQAAVQDGFAVCNSFGYPLDYVLGPDHENTVVVESEGALCLIPADKLRMRPMVWVDGRPVYQYETLWYYGFIGGKDDKGWPTLVRLMGSTSHPESMYVREVTPVDQDSTSGFTVNLCQLSCYKERPAADPGLMTIVGNKLREFWNAFSYDGGVLPEYVTNLQNQVDTLQEQLLNAQARAAEYAEELTELKNRKPRVPRAPKVAANPNDEL